jgi:hypothetical protein
MKAKSVLALFFAASLSARATDPGLTLIPEHIHLTGEAARQQLIVEKLRSGLPAGQLTNDLTYRVDPPGVVDVQSGVVIPLTNGTATITVTSDGRTAAAMVTVAAVEKPVEPSFRNDVQPLLAKAGCSAGACHGAAAGQNGFKLSLRGYDNEGDFLALTRNAFGRRIIPSDPGRSLILLKPTAAVPHKGGKRFEAGSLDYKVLAGWIAAGAPGPKESDARIARIEILPEHLVLEPGAIQQILVRAWFSDGRFEDVTHWAKFNAANATVAQIDDEGRIKVVGNGEGAVTAWYLSRIAIATVTAPQTNFVPPELFSNFKRRNFIDDLVLEKLATLNVPPSPACSDAQFIRRAFLDATGVLPKEKEVRQFLADESSDKREKLVDHLMRRSEFVDYWAYKWSDLLLVNSKKLRPAAMWAYYDWIRNNVSANTPWDQFAREIVTAQGSTLENGAGNFYVLHDDPLALTENISLAFLGMSINCARCHNHPMEKWTNDQYYGMANLFARVHFKTGRADGESVVFAADEGDLIQPLTGKPQPPRPLDGEAVPLDSREDRRNALADWLVSRENPYFSRAIVNRVWANFFGAGLVENVDDLRVTNPASNEKLLFAAASYLADHHYDLRALMRAIMTSQTYQLSSAPLPENKADTRFYSHYYPKRLMAEVLLDAVAQVTGTENKFPNYPPGFRAVQLPDANVDSYFLKTFGRPDRNVTCECERSAEPSITQVLHLANGDTINSRLEEKHNRIGKLLEQDADAEDVITEAYYSAFSRPPTDEELRKIEAPVGKAKDSEKRAAYEDVYWALLSSKEFLFNH